MIKQQNSISVEAGRENFQTNSRFKDLTGKQFGYLLVIKIFGYRKYKNSQLWLWKCECICGNIRKCSTNELERKKKPIYSCGCKRYSRNTPNQIYDVTEAAYRAKASNYKALAKHRGIVWDLSIQQVTSLFKGNCFYCGCVPSNEYSLLRNRRNKNLILSPATEEKHKVIMWNGIDRLNNSKGYVEGNCVSCCTDCNSAKMQRSVEEFYSWIDLIIEQRRKNG